MTDKQIWTEIAELMQEMLERDELQLKHVKTLNKKIDLLWKLVPALSALTLLPESPEKLAAADRLRRAFEDPELQDEARRILAQHESQHERRAAFLAQMKERIEGL